MNGRRDAGVFIGTEARHPTRGVTGSLPSAKADIV